MDGTSWTNAYPGNILQSVITNAQAGDEVWVACGTYTPTTTTDRDQSFSMKNNVAVYGSFQGTENQVDERNLDCLSCSILSGEIGASGVADNSYHVISNQQLNESATLDGFVISGANDDRTVSDFEGLGGGVYNNGRYNGGLCNPVFRNCVITGNYAYFGGGVFNNGSLEGESSPMFINCIISENTAGNGGGGMDNFGLGGTANPTLINCLLINNTAQTAGGMYNWGGNPGGQASPRFINCVISGNSATNGNAGGFICDNSNSGPGNDGISAPDLINTIVWNNTTSMEGPQFYCKGTSTVAASNCVIDYTNQNPPHTVTIGTNNLNGNPLFVNSADGDGPDNCWLTADDGFRLTGTSPAINTGIIDDLPDTDIAGDPRVFGGNVDPGAYEYNNLGVGESSFTFSVYPNPTNAQLIVQSQLPQTLQLLAVSGEIIRTISTENTITVIDLGALPAGCYFLQNGNKKGLPIVVQP